METPLPNDSFQASLSPPVGGHLHSFRRDWLTNKCSDVLNIITNGYVLPFISKPNIVRAPLIQSGYKALQKELALTSCIQSLLSKNTIERVENVKSLGFYSCLFLVPKPHQSWRPVIDLSRLNTFLLVERFKMETPSSHQGLSDSRGMGVVDRPSRRLPSPPHPPKLEEVAKVLPQVASVSVHFPFLRTSHGPSGLYNDCKRGEADGPVKGNQTSPVPGRLADWGPVSGRSTSKHSDSGGPNSVLRVDNKSGEVRTKANSGGLRIPSRFSPCKTTRERWLKLQNLILRLKSKHVLTARCFMSLIGLLASAEKMVPEGCLHMRPFQFHLKEHWRYPQPLDTLLPWTETTSAHLDWWHNPTNMMKRADFHPKDHSIQLSYRCIKRRLGRSLRANLCKRSVVRQGKKATHKCSRAEGGFSGPSKVQGPVSKPNSVGCNGQLNSGSLHKQTRRCALSCGRHGAITTR